MKDKLLKLLDFLNLYGSFNMFTKNRAMVLMIHRFCKWGERDGTRFPADILDQSLHYLIENGYSVISLSNYVDKLKNHAQFYKTVAFTVDDGYHDFFEFGYPIFKKYEIPVAMFLATDFVDGNICFWWDKIRMAINNTEKAEVEIEYGGEVRRFSLRGKGERMSAIDEIIVYCKNLSGEGIKKIEEKLFKLLNVSMDEILQGGERALTWDEIIEMEEHGVEFFPHSKTHPILVHCSEKHLYEEIYGSKKRIESKLGKPANIFCYPNGRFCDFNNFIIGVLKDAGYVAAFTVEEGFDHHPRGDDLFMLKRYSLPDDFSRFKKYVSGLEALQNKLEVCRTLVL